MNQNKSLIKIAESMQISPELAEECPDIIYSYVSLNKVGGILDRFHRDKFPLVKQFLNGDYLIAGRKPHPLRSHYTYLKTTLHLELYPSHLPQRVFKDISQECYCPSNLSWEGCSEKGEINSLKEIEDCIHIPYEPVGEELSQRFWEYLERRKFYRKVPSGQIFPRSITPENIVIGLVKNQRKREESHLKYLKERDKQNKFC